MIATSSAKRRQFKGIGEGGGEGEEGEEGEPGGHTEVVPSEAAARRAEGSELMYKEYRCGERTEPCRTPVTGVKGAEE
jgi:hypothetical protein